MSFVHVINPGHLAPGGFFYIFSSWIQQLFWSEFCSHSCVHLLFLTRIANEKNCNHCFLNFGFFSARKRRWKKNFSKWEQNSEKKISFWDWIPNNQESQLFSIIGRLTTFNFNNNVNSAHLQSQDYAICIRREVGKKWIKPSQFHHNIKCKIVPGNCCIEYSVCEDPNSFSIDNTRD